MADSSAAVSRTSAVYNSGSIVVAAPATATSADLDVSGLRQITLDYNVTAVGGAGSVTFTVNRKSLSGVYFPITTGTAITAAGQQSVEIGPGLNVNKSLGATVQISWTVVVSATFTISVQGRG